ncbi:unnamed protein product, partial [Rotaria sp. Silwood2]
MSIDESLVEHLV